MVKDILKRSIFDYFFINNCICCHSNLSSIKQDVCDSCLARIVRFDTTGKCPVCGFELIDSICCFCNDRKVYFDKCCIGTEYNEVIQKIFYYYKVKNCRRLSIPLTTQISSLFDEMEKIFDLVTCVPSSKDKMSERGYNPAELLAKGISRRYKIPFHYLLVKKDNHSQKKEKYTGRFINIIDSFKVNKSDEIAGKNILIIDDIFTTGATLNECARMLKENGAKSIICAVVAKVVIKKLEIY